MSQKISGGENSWKPKISEGKNFSLKIVTKIPGTNILTRKIPGVENPSGEKILEDRKKIPRAKNIRKKILKLKDFRKKILNWKILPEKGFGG